MRLFWRAQMELNPLRVEATGGAAATVTYADFIACQVVEHVIDRVLLSSEARMQCSHAGGL
jgi:hypothetical protein